MKTVLTLCVPVTENKILLGMKKRGFGLGRWNGFGGKIQKDEMIEEATRREVIEEVGITDGELRKAGVLEFSFENTDTILQVHIFRLSDFSDAPIESEEMKPKWFSIDEIPFAQMWPDDAYWIPLFLQGKLFEGKFLFDRPSDAEYSAKILSKELHEVSAINSVRPFLRHETDEA